MEDIRDKFPMLWKMPLIVIQAANQFIASQDKLYPVHYYAYNRLTKTWALAGKADDYLEIDLVNRTVTGKLDKANSGYNFWPNLQFILGKNWPLRVDFILQVPEKARASFEISELDGKIIVKAEIPTAKGWDKFNIAATDFDKFNSLPDTIGAILAKGAIANWLSVLDTNGENNEIT